MVIRLNIRKLAWPYGVRRKKLMHEHGQLLQEPRGLTVIQRLINSQGAHGTYGEAFCTRVYGIIQCLFVSLLPQLFSL